MPIDSSNYQIICPKCGGLYESDILACPGCGQVNAQAPINSAPSRKPKPPRGPILPDFSIFIKTALILALIAIPAWLLFEFSDYLFRTVEQSSSYPTNPADTITNFFDALQQEDYQNCYGLLDKERIISTVIGKNSRDNYFHHFARIRDYLVERVEPEFTWDMQVAYDGKRVQFGTDIVLTFSLVSVRGMDKLSHYAIKEINEFPLDVAPGMGIEKRNRMLNRMVESVDALERDQKDMDVADILEPHADESSTARRNRWIEAFHYQRQLDTRHTLLEWIIREYPQDSKVKPFLDKIAQDDSEVFQLRQLAH